MNFIPQSSCLINAAAGIKERPCFVSNNVFGFIFWDGRILDSQAPGTDPNESMRLAVFNPHGEQRRESMQLNPAVHLSGHSSE